MSSTVQPEAENNQQNRSIEVTMAQGTLRRTSILAIHFKDHKLGWSTIDQSIRKLTCYYDITLSAYDQSSEFKDIFKNLVSQINPKTVVISTNIPLDMEKVIRDQDDATGYEVLLKPSQSFSKFKAMAKIESILKNNPNVFYPTYEQKIAMSRINLRQNDAFSEIDLNPYFGSLFENGNDISTECVSALISLSETETGYDFDQYISTFDVGSFNKTMIINEDCMHALKILDNSTHPNFHSTNRNQQIKTMCLFDILNQTCSPMGQELMKSWFKQPSTNIDIIRARHELISVFVDPTSADIIKSLRKLLRGLKNIPRILEDISVGRAKIKDWSALLTFFNSFKLMQESFQEVFRSRPVMINESVQQVFTGREIDINIQNIDNIIDFDQSKLNDRIVVRRNVDIELDKLKDSYEQIEDILSEVAARISKALPQVSHPINVMYFPQLGYLIVFERAHQEKSMPMVEQGVWEIIFSTDSHIYFKSKEMREMDNQFGDIYGVICDHEIEIVQSLQEEILKTSSKLLAASHLCAQIDCHLAFAEVAKMRDYVKPEMTTERSLKIVEGLHPIYEQVVNTFIANNTSFPENQSSITLLTGANYSGKTVYLAQTALIVYMAHIGSFVPARSAKIGITDRILARLSNRESVSRTKSSFVIDLEQMSSIFRLMTPSSLILVDEFGKGTDVADGASLFGAMINYFQMLGDNCPKVLASTHFHELLKNGVIDTSRLNLCHMQVLLDESTPENGTKSITYLYKLQHGEAISSFGINCAALCGIDHSIISKAQIFYKHLIQGENLAKYFMTLSKEEAQKLKIASKSVRKFLSQNIDTIPDVVELLKSITNETEN